MSLNPYENEEYDCGAPDRVKEWIDERVETAGGKIYRGGLQVLTSGFGKGLLVTAGLITAGTVGLALFAPAMIGVSAALTAGQAVTTGLAIAGNTLLGSGAGIAALAAGGAAGSLVAAHGENSRIGKEAAEDKARLYAMARERAAAGTSPSVADDMNMGSGLACGGYCAAMMQNRNQPRGRASR